MLDLIVVGLGPAGLALAHRAHQRGWNVLGFDPNPEWEHTIGFWIDELPAWLNVPIQGSCQPRVHANGYSRTIAREYAILDASTFRQRYSTFPILRQSAHIIDAHTVRAATKHTAHMVVDTRGCTNEAGPFQQAVGCLIPNGNPWWMNVHNPTFTYCVPIGQQWLTEETILITQTPVPWSELECVLPCPPSEHVLFSMNIPKYKDHAIPFGARAGMLNPITGYSVGTSWRYIDDVLDGKYPWRKYSWRIEQMLLKRSQNLLLNIDQDRFFAEVFQLPDQTLKRFLALGDLPGTLIGMWKIFSAAPWLRRDCIRAMLKPGTQPT